MVLSPSESLGVENPGTAGECSEALGFCLSVSTALPDGARVLGEAALGANAGRCRGMRWQCYR
jgi:hypothetical protein